jgi:Na+/proline symporter
MIGGMRAIIWTDVAQFFVLFGSVAAMLTLAFVRSGGPVQVLQTAAAAGKFAPPAFFSLTDDLSVVSGLCLGFIGLLGSAGTDQVLLQTYMTAKSVNEAKKSLWFNGIFLKPLSLIFPTLGIVIYVYYQHHPEHAALMRIPDDALPVFILNVLPTGVRGLAIAAIMSALLTSLGSGLSALAASTQVDFLQRGMRRRLSERAAVRLGRVLTLSWGIVIIAAASFVLTLGRNNNIIQILNIVMYPFTGVLLGIFLTGLLTRRANGTGVLIGAIVGFAATMGLPRLGWAAGLSNFYYGALGTLATLATGYAASLLFPAPPVEKLAGLTHAKLPEAQPATRS